ncbi:MAG: ABC-type transport auxiliary lipoprotein family protein [Gammaproteobacteria bacterium]
MNGSYALILSFLWLLGGCSITPGQPALHDFGSGPATSSTRSQMIPNVTVNSPKWLQDTRIRYRLLYSEPTRVRFYALSRWIAPPTELLEQQLKLSLLPPNGFVKVTLLEFEQQFVSANQSKAVLNLFAEVYTADHHSFKDAKEFRMEQWTSTPNAEGAVDAFSLLTRKAAGQLQSWLDGSTP